MGYTCFEIEESDGVAHVVLSRPDEFNTMVPAFWSELPEIINGLSDSGRVRAVVVSSTGDPTHPSMNSAHIAYLLSQPAPG